MGSITDGGGEGDVYVGAGRAEWNEFTEAIERNPGPKSKLIMPATQGDTPRSLEYKDGDVLERYEIGEQLANTENGGQGTVYRAKRRSDGLDVVLKVYATAERASDWDQILNEERRAGREIRFLERANRDGILGVPVVVEYGVTGSFVKTPVAVFNHIQGRSLEEEVLDENYNPSAYSVLNLLRGLVAPLDYAHHSNGAKPVVHRDINPGNIKVNGHPILMDWASSTPTSGRTQLRTQMFTEYFTAPEVFGGDAFDARADIYSLGRVLQFTLLGKTFRDAEGEPSSDDFKSLNIPKDVVKVLEKATQKNPEKRYRTIREFNNAFEKVYGVTQTKMPARAETQKKEVANPGNAGLPDVIDNGDGRINIDGYEFDKKSNIFETAKAIYDYIGEHFMHETNEGIVDTHRDFLGNNWKFVLAYLQHTAQKHPILQDAVEGRRSLEDAVREKGPSLLKAIILDDWSFLNKENKGKYKLEIKQFQQRRKELCDVFGVDEKNFDLFDEGGVYGGVAGVTGSILGLAIKFGIPLMSTVGFTAGLMILGGGALGMAAGSYTQTNLANKKLSKSAREMDSWLAQARVAQQGGLERKAESVELTNGEKNGINSKSLSYGIAIGLAGGVTSILLDMPGGDWFSLPIISSLVPYFGTTLGLKKLLTNRALKKKRIAAGLDKDGMREIETIEIPPERYGNIEAILVGGHNLRKNFFNNRFNSDGLDVRYGILNCEQHKGWFEVTIKAIPEAEERAKQLAKALSDGAKVPYPRVVETGSDDEAKIRSGKWRRSSDGSLEPWPPEVWE